MGRNPEEKGAWSIEWAGQLQWEIGNNTVGLFSIANCEFLTRNQKLAKHADNDSVFSMPQNAIF